MKPHILDHKSSDVTCLSTDFSQVAQDALDFLSANRLYLRYSQLSLWTTKNHVNDSREMQLGSGCGSFRRLNVPYRDEDFVVPVSGTEFLLPVVRFMEDRGVKLCRPMLRIMAPKTCLSYHKDGNPYRVHVVCQTSGSSMFIVDGNLYTMNLVGGLYSLRTDLLHTAINASYEHERIHVTLTVSN